MKTVLIVDDEKLFLASLVEGLTAYAEGFDVVTAENGKKALEILDSRPIDAVMTDLKMPVMDGFQLLAQMTKSHPQVPVIVMTAFGTPEIEERISVFDAFRYMEKPIDFEALADQIRAALAQTSEGHIQGITLFSFLQLLEMEKKTCLLKIKSKTRQGLLHILKGEIINASYNEFEGEEAAYQIVCWENAEVEILAARKNIKKSIEIPLSMLLMEAARLRDESGATESEAAFFEDGFEHLEAPIGGKHSDDIFGQAGDVEKLEPLFTDAKEIDMANTSEALDALLKIDGAMAAALVDAKSGMALGTIGSGINLEVAAAGNSEVIRSKQKVMSSLGLKDKIEDILITLGQQYHLIRPLATAENLFVYLVLNKTQANLAMARFKLQEIETALQV